MKRLLFTVILLAVAAYSLPILAQSSVKSPHGDIKMDCFSCHTTESWTKVKQPMDFDHDNTGFRLMGAHKFTDCMSCHQSAKFADIGIACADCHTDVHQRSFGIDCASCHTSDNWNSQLEVFETHASRGFPLTGVHALADCQSCHTNAGAGEFRGISQDCASCHTGDFARADNPNHIKASFELQCLNCHQSAAVEWQRVEYEHPESFELKGAHAFAECRDCHEQTFIGTPKNCVNCHQPEFEAAVSPNHTQFGFPTNCETCHTETQWAGAEFDHLQASGFAINGAHQAILCTDCHTNNQITGLPRDCAGCHQDDFNTVQEPNHVQNNFPLNCMVCHTEASWEPATFDHNLTGFPLTGAHQPLDCASCHVNGQFSGTPNDCFSCHDGDFNSVQEPNHVQNNFSMMCLDCHTTEAWEPATFDHANTNFPLTGAHLQLECIDCHSSGYTNTPTQCITCHQSDFNNVQDPNHVQNNFSTMCLDCHTTEAWEPAVFDHANTTFPLTGAHVTLNCIDCHAQGYVNTPTDCFSCHDNDFNNVQDPNHVQNNFSMMCLDCHTTEAWEPAVFDHANTTFPLTGAHVTLNCIDCHAQGYVNTPTYCFSCHDNDFNNVQDPNHVQNNFSMMCLDCHTTEAWEPAAFDHANTIFPLTGAHVTLNCIDCHAAGYTNTPTDCYSCHDTDYNNTNNPNHQAAGFPTDCMVCHNTSNWTQTTWDHDGQYFPIYSGKHQGEWNNCTDCHVNPANYQVFECIVCHEHRRSEMDDEHSDVPGYVYESTACLNCHPNGEEKVRPPRHRRFDRLNRTGYSG